ncbi:MAG: hypothetical protein PHI58_04515 [Candidatus Omnitrophica bacterium]|nr:hypothetical protein [Candidatus Omnitrophota bacterium]
MRRDLPDTHPKTEIELGEQPIAKIIAEHKLKPHDIVAASTEQITHKMIAKAVKGRRLTPNVQQKVLNALNKLTGKKYSLKDLFNY